jgi:hypothetical protein
VRGDIPIDSEALLVTDFVNLKIKPAQSFRDAHRGRMYVCMFVELSVHICMSIYVCTVFLKKLLKDSNLIHKPHPFVMGNGKNVIHATHILHG